MEPDLPTPQQLVEQLSDERVLHSYCTFNMTFRPLIATTLFAQLSEDEALRRAVALEIASCWVAALEDLVMWIQVLRMWRPGKDLLFDRLDSTQIIENDGPQSTKRILDDLASWTVTDLRRELRLPSHDELRAIGFDAERLAAYDAGLGGFLRLLPDLLSIRTSDENVVVTSYNKIKHGLLAVRSTMGSAIGVSFLLASRKGPVDPGSGRRMINASWLPCENQELRKLVFDTIVVSEALFVLLNWLYAARFDADWVFPPWPFDVREWAQAANDTVS